MSKKVIIVGGVAAGASTAARLRRMDEQAEIIIFERGENISFANCGLPYYIGNVIENRQDLLIQTPASMYTRFNIDVRNLSEVMAIDPQTKEVQVHILSTGEKYRETYDYLVLCPGASPIIPPIKGVNKANVFTVRNIPDSDRIKAHVQQLHSQTENPRAIVVGAGYIGLEMADMLYHSGLEVSMVEAAPQVMGAIDPDMASIIHMHLSDQGIKLYLSEKALEFTGQDEVEQVVLESGKVLDTDLVILGTGVKPEVWLAEQAGLKIGQNGGIEVDEYLRSSDPSIYAAGDAIETQHIVSKEKVLLPMASPANRQGWIIANNIAGRPIPYSGVQGTGIVDVMGLAVAVTGLNETALQSAGIDYCVCHTHPFSHATYYPNSEQMTFKLLFTPEEGKILGAQIIGKDGVDKRIDVIATAIRAGMTVFDLQELELAYAPPFSSAKDPVNLTAYTAANIVLHDVEVIRWEDVPAQVRAGAVILDVRMVQERNKMGAIPASINIPLDELRQHLDQVPRDREILVHCALGLRSYIACRILMQNGFKVKNISGGYRMYRFLQHRS